MIERQISNSSRFTSSAPKATTVVQWYSGCPNHLLCEICITPSLPSPFATSLNPRPATTNVPFIFLPCIYLTCRKFLTWISRASP